MSCKHDCETPPLFPRRIDNRPGLARIDYRIGHYADVRAHLLAQLDRSPLLAGLTHREADDPAIALLEGDAIVIDILAFYQSLYANEAYLRTAQWPQSIADLVRLSGYRLAPGVAGEATFALLVKGNRPISVPAGFGLKAQLEASDKPVEFETRHGIEAVPALSAFALYRPRLTPALANGSRVLRLGTGAAALKPGDRLLLGQAQGNAQAARLLNTEIVEIEKIHESFGQRFATLKTGLVRTTAVGSLRAYKIGESLRHFGHAAPATISTVSADGVPSTRTTSYLRRVDSTTGGDVSPALAALDLPLEREFDAIRPGDHVVVQGRFSALPGSVAHRYSLVRRVTDSESRSLAWGMQTGASNVLSLNASLLVHDGGHGHPYSDVRSLGVMQVTAEPFTVYADYAPTAATNGNSLRYYGRAEDARALKGRRLLLADAAGATQSLRVQSVGTQAVAGDAFHLVQLDRPVAYADFPYEQALFGVHANLVDASQGKTIARSAIGSGDARALFQTFALPKSPLTYLFDAARTPAQVPALEVYVDAIRWNRVDTLFNAGPLDTVYIVCEAEDGSSCVQFGDGKTGARPGSGQNNIVAVYRTGIGAHGLRKADTTPQASGKLAGLDKVLLPAAVTTGCEAESAGSARRTAPARLQSLGRLVSIADYEAETRMLPNVLKANARWDAPDGVPAIVLTVLTRSGAAADLEQIRDALTHYSRCRGPARHPFLAFNGTRRYVRIDALVGYDAAHLPDEVTHAIRIALGPAGSDVVSGDVGLFGLEQREFHSNVHISQIIAAIQQVPGVVWVRLRAAQVLPAGDDPLLLPLPLLKTIPSPTLGCPPRQLLALHDSHLNLALVDARLSAECPP